MSKNSIKDKIQGEALAKVKEHDRPIVVAATGSGKSKIAVDYSKYLVGLKRNAKILIIVPTEKLRDINWLEEFEKWKAKTIWTKNVDRSCYVSANKIEKKEYDLVILDEIHNITENNSEFFHNNKVDKCLGLTATLPEDEEKKKILSDLGFEVVYHLPLDEAVRLGIVSPFEVVVVEVDLDDEDKYVKSGTQAKPFYQTEKKKYEYLDLMVRRLMFSNNAQARTNLKFKILERMRFIYNLRSKTEATQWLLEHVVPKDERTLIFCGSIEQAIAVSDYRFFSKPSYKKGNKRSEDRAKALIPHFKGDKDFNRFKEEKINRLACINALNEGHNIPNVDNGVVAQLNSKELNLVQRIGRTIRYREGHTAKIWIVCALGTQDEKWVEKALENFDQSSVRYVRFKNLVNKRANA